MRISSRNASARVMTMLVVALVALSASPSLAQENIPDTLDWHGYFPLEVGNRWQYQGTSWGVFGITEEWYELWDVVGDTIIESWTYFVVERTCQSVKYSPYFPSPRTCEPEMRERIPLRYDEHLANVLRRTEPDSDPGEEWWWRYDFRLNAPFYSTEPAQGDFAEAYEYHRVDAIDISGERVETTVKIIGVESAHPGSLIFAHGIGFAWTQFDEGGGSSLELVYADVGGRRYGRAEGLSVDRLAFSGNDHIDVYPNPAAQSINVRFDLIAAGRVEVHVLDVIGRVVMRNEPRFRFAGRQVDSIVLHGISSGVYQVVIMVDGEVAATKPIVVIR